VSSSPIIEILSGLDSYARAEVSILSHPDDALGIHIISLT